MNPKDLWFNTPDSNTLCRGGGNGPLHPSQLYAIKKYVIGKFDHPVTMLDYGCGSATTFEGMKIELPGVLGKKIIYTGTDVIPKNIEWDKETFPDGNFVVNKESNKITQPDKSFDIVYSRHVVDHMRSFEDAVDEHCRVAKEMVIIILWYSFASTDDHVIKNIDYSHEENGRVYPDEYLNSYSGTKCMKYLKGKEDWEILEVTQGVGSEVKGNDAVIVLKHK